MKRQLYFIAFFFASFAYLIAMQGCSSGNDISEEDEEALYLLVGGPCADGDYATAIRRADSLLGSPAVMSDSLRAYIMIERDIAIMEGGNLDWGDAYADTVIDFGHRKEVALAVMQGLQHKGIVSRRKGDWSRAIAYYKDGMEIAVECGDADMEQVFAEMLAIACGENKLYDEASSFGRRSLDLAVEAGDSISELNSVATLGAILAKSGQYRQAIDVLVPYHEWSRTTRGLLRVKYLTPLLLSFLELDSLQAVRGLLGETYEALDGVPRNTQAYLVAVNTEAGLAGKEGRYPDQWHWLQVADTIGAMGTNPEQWFMTRAECLANLGRYDDAYDMQKKALEALDSIRSSETDRQLSELMVKYDSLKKDNDIMRLESQRMFWTLVAVGCASLVAVLVLIAVGFARKARRRLERERSEQYIRGLEEERHRLARELHDDIAGSLVGLQCGLHTSGADAVDDDLAGIIRRVRTMSHELMPPEFSRKTFIELLSDFVRRFNSEGNSCTIRLEKSGSYRWENLSPSDSHELYRIVQEAARNAVSHGRGGEIRMALSGDGEWRLEVISRSLPDSSVAEGGGIGFRTIRNRAAIIGASVDVVCDNDLFIVKIYR